MLIQGVIHLQSGGNIVKGLKCNRKNITDVNYEQEKPEEKEMGKNRRKKQTEGQTSWDI